METIEKGIVLGSKGKLECVLVKEVLEVIDKENKKCKAFIKEQRGYLKLKEMTNKEWIKGRIEECEFTIEMLGELKTRINGTK